MVFEPFVGLFAGVFGVIVLLIYDCNITMYTYIVVGLLPYGPTV